MNIYICNYCDYKSTKKQNTIRHIPVCRHINVSAELINREPKVVEIGTNTYICQYCGRDYSRLSGLLRHEKACKTIGASVSDVKAKYKLKYMKCKVETTEQLIGITDKNSTKIMEVNDKVIEAKDQVIEAKDKLIESMAQARDSVIREKDTLIDFYKKMIFESGSALTTSVSSLKYITMTYPNAPILECLEDYHIILEDRTWKQFADEMIYSFNKRALPRFLGNILVKYYKKDDPSKQSFWNSDSARRTYLTSVIVSNTVLWDIDKKGTQIKNTIIRPMLEFITLIIVEEIENSKTNNTMPNHIILANIERSKTLNIIKQKIDIKGLDDEILRYITPFFHIKATSRMLKNINTEPPKQQLLLTVD